MKHPIPRKVKWLAAASLVAIVAFLCAELFARLVLGLGSPPLYVADPEIGYLNKPSTEVSRFGNRVAYNAYGMRSGALPRERSHPEELRLIVVGDSVVHGGAMTDQSQLATALLAASLERELGRPVIVGNVAAGGWAPENELAYLRRYGTFDAAFVMLVLNHEDARSAPASGTAVGVDPSFPDKAPRLAVVEGATRYMPRYLPTFGEAKPAAAPEPPAAPRPESLEAIRQMIALVRERGATPVVVLYPSRAEAEGEPSAGYRAIQREAERAGAAIIDLHPIFAEAAVDEVFRDAIHPSPAGQALMADAWRQWIVETVKRN